MHEVRACGFWEFRGLSVNISKAGKRSFSATHFKKCISFTDASYGVWSRRIDPHFKTPDGEPRLGIDNNVIHRYSERPLIRN